MAKWDYLKNASNKEVVDGVMNDKPGGSKVERKGKGLVAAGETVSTVTFEKANNGFMVRISYKNHEEKNDKGETHTRYIEDSKAVMKDSSEAQSIIDECFG